MENCAIGAYLLLKKTSNMPDFSLKSHLHCGDSLDVLKGMPYESVDLTVTSPPYDDMRAYQGYSFDFENIAKELYRVTKIGGVLVWVVGDATKNISETGTSFRQALFFMDVCKFNLADTMIYRKLNGAMGSIYTYLQEFEYMFVFSRGAPKTVSFLRDRKNAEGHRKTTVERKSDKNGTVKKRVPFQFSEYGRRKNIWEYAVGGVQEFGYHPAPFPEGLARDHILSWSNPGDMVLDPFCGSGTTGKMAIMYDRNFIGIDISQEYIDIAAKRIASVQKQMKLPILGK